MKLKPATVKKWKRDALELAHKTQSIMKGTFLSDELIKQCNKTAMLALLLEEEYERQAHIKNTKEISSR